MFVSLKYWLGACAYSESVWQGFVGQDVLVDVGLTWRVTPQVSEGRTSRTTVRASVSMHPLVESHCGEAVEGDFSDQ